jgi:hypothetical protein
MADRVFMQSPQGEIKEVEATAESLSPFYSESRIIPDSTLGWCPVGAGT